MRGYPASRDEYSSTDCPLGAAARRKRLDRRTGTNSSTCSLSSPAGGAFFNSASSARGSNASSSASTSRLISATSPVSPCQTNAASSRAWNERCLDIANRAMAAQDARPALRPASGRGSSLDPRPALRYFRASIRVGEWLSLVEHLVRDQVVYQAERSEEHTSELE